MIIQLVLTICFLMLFLVSLVRLKKVRSFAIFLSVISVIGGYFVWSPVALTKIANYIGVGRGADLLLYIFFIFVVFELLIVKLREKEKEELFTLLIRKLAISEAKYQKLKQIKPFQ